MKILYLCSDLGIPVLGRHGASVHVRSLVAAFERSGHSVILVAPLLNKSPWEKTASISASVIHLPPAADTNAAVLALKTFNRTVGVSNTLPGEVSHTRPVMAADFRPTRRDTLTKKARLHRPRATAPPY